MTGIFKVNNDVIDNFRSMDKASVYDLPPVFHLVLIVSLPSLLIEKRQEGDVIQTKTWTDLIKGSNYYLQIRLFVLHY